MTDSLVSHYLRVEVYDRGDHGPKNIINSYYSIPNGTFRDLEKIIELKGCREIRIRCEQN